MNLYEAKEILELQDGYSEDDVKKNYRRLIMKYHPDKLNGSSEMFIKVQEAYKEVLRPADNVDFIKNIFKIFVPNFKKETPKIKVTIQEYIKGTSKQIRKNCNCEKSLCLNCAGSGYSVPSLEVCMDCIGDGYQYICNCHQIIKIKPFQKNEILLEDDNYFIKGGKLYCNFDISFKESLLGFEKTFIDPLDRKHLITVNKLIKNGDGYSIKINGNELILLFKIEYPKVLSVELKNILNEFLS